MTNRRFLLAAGLAAAIEAENARLPPSGPAPPAFPQPAALPFPLTAFRRLLTTSFSPRARL